MSTCKTCAYWQQDDPGYYPEGTSGMCYLTLVMAGKEPNDKALFWANCTCDMADINNQWVGTDATFGCVHWKATR